MSRKTLKRRMFPGIGKNVFAAVQRSRADDFIQIQTNSGTLYIHDADEIETLLKALAYVAEFGLPGMPPLSTFVKTLPEDLARELAPFRQLLVDDEGNVALDGQPEPEPNPPEEKRDPEGEDAHLFVRFDALLNDDVIDRRTFNIISGECGFITIGDALEGVARGEWTKERFFEIRGLSEKSQTWQSIEELLAQHGIFPA